jgi:hypothetical protein
MRELLSKRLAYLLKMALFSAIALVPVMLFNRYLSGFFMSIDAGNRFTSYALPLLLTLILFAGTGVALLFVTGSRLSAER